MRILRHRALASLALTLLAPLTLSNQADAATTIVANPPFRLDKVQQETGGQGHTAIALRGGGHGFIATWLNYRSSTDRRAEVGFFSASASGVYPISQMGAASGPTSGIPAFGAAPVGFADDTSLVLFSANKRGAAAANARDVFAQRMKGGPWTPTGTPLPVNATLTSSQDTPVTTPLSTGNALVAFVTHAAAASSFDIHGRVLNKNGAGVTGEKAITVNTAGAQTPTALAGLSAPNAGGSVLAYVVKTGARQDVFLQRLNSALTRVGNPILLKTTTTAATYGGAGVAPLSGGRFFAAWFVAGSGGTAVLKGRIYSAAGVGVGTAAKTIGATRVRNTTLSVPRIAVAPDGQIMVVTDGLSGSTYSLEAWLLDKNATRLVGPTKLVTGSTSLTAQGALRLNTGYFVTSYTLAASQPTATRAMGVLFRAVDCGRC